MTLREFACRCFGHADDVTFKNKPVDHPARQGKGWRWLVRADAIYTCRRCGRREVKE